MSTLPNATTFTEDYLDSAISCHDKALRLLANFRADEAATLQTPEGKASESLIEKTLLALLDTLDRFQREIDRRVAAANAMANQNWKWTPQQPWKPFEDGPLEVIDNSPLEDEMKLFLLSSKLDPTSLAIVRQAQSFDEAINFLRVKYEFRW
uniref:UBA domain-containing protein n=1 Tax=Panagrellus redivivus TaxID=6233 RepID=A0A7E4VAF4_PANRE